MTTAAIPKPAAVIETAPAAEPDDFELTRPLSVNIRPILESVAGKLTDDEIDQWFVEFAKANEGRGFYLELTAKGELVINPMVNLHSGIAEAEGTTDLMIWSREHGGVTLSSRTIVRLPDGARAEPDLSWLSPRQVSELGSVLPRILTVCPIFVGEIMSESDRLPPMQRKMERYIANGAQLGWLIDPYRRQVHIYRPNTPVEVLDNPESVSGDPILPGFVFEVRRRIFALHDTAAE